MSDNNSAAPKRNEAVRTFASEYTEATTTFSESNADKAAQYSLLPTGVGANRVMMMGTLLEVSRTKSDRLCGTIHDGTGSFKVYAGQFNQQACSKLKELEPDGNRTKLEAGEYEHVMVIGKTNSYESSGTWYVTVEPEVFIVSDKETRERWEAETAEKTLERIESFENDDAPRGKTARDHYDFDMSELRGDVEAVVEDLLPEVPTVPATAPSPDVTPPVEE